LLIEQDARSVNAVTVADDAWPSHPCTQVGSVGKHASTQVAITEHAESLGQLVGFKQQLAVMQVTHAAVVAPKMVDAPGHDVASPLPPVDESSLAASLCGETPPPMTPPEQGTPSTSMHPGSIGGCVLLDEQANAAPRSPASAGPTTRPTRKETVLARVTMALTQFVLPWRCCQVRGVEWSRAARTAAHTSRSFVSDLACRELARLRQTSSVRSN
jgi:hypothetical protein